MESNYRNRIIQGSIICCHVIQVFLILLFSVFLFFLIGSLFSPASFDYLILTQSFKAGWGVGPIRICPGCSGPGDLLLSDLGFGMKCWLAVRATFFFLIAWLILRSLLEILKSVRSLDTFYEGNIRHFQTLAVYGMLAFVMSTFNVLVLKGDASWDFTLAFGPMLFSFACLTLSEVFKEGQLLVEDKNAII